MWENFLRTSLKTLDEPRPTFDLSIETTLFGDPIMRLTLTLLAAALLLATHANAQTATVGPVVSGDGPRIDRRATDITDIVELRPPLTKSQDFPNSS